MDSTELDQAELVVETVRAIRASDADRLASLLAAGPELVGLPLGFSNETALHVAAESGSAEVVRLLMAHGADLSARIDQPEVDRHGTMPLAWAAAAGDLAMVRLLVASGASVADTADVRGWGALGWATLGAGPHVDVADYLLEQGARPDIFMAIALDRPLLVRELIGPRPELLDARHDSIVSPLAFAALRGRAAIVDTLLELGAPVDLLSAVLLGRTGEARSAYAKDGAGEELHWFAKQGRADGVRLLLELGADPSARDAGGATALHFAAVNGFLSIAELLIDHGADLDVQDFEHGMAPHMWANAFGQPESVELLLTRGARINLQEAARIGQVPIVEGILNAFPAAIDVRRGWATPLVSAVSEGQVEVVRALLERGASPSAPSADGRTPLQVAAVAHGEAQDEIMALLRSKGAR